MRGAFGENGGVLVHACLFQAAMSYEAHSGLTHTHSSWHRLDSTFLSTLTLLRFVARQALLGLGLG